MKFNTIRLFIVNTIITVVNMITIPFRLIVVLFFVCLSPLFFIMALFEDNITTFKDYIEDVWECWYDLVFEELLMSKFFKWYRRN